MLRNSLLSTVIFCLVGLTGAYGQDGLALMKVEAGARPAGMGGAFVAVSGDANSGYYNPAGAVGSDGFAASFGYNTYWSDIRLETAYFTASMTRRLWLHGGIRYAAVENLESRTAPTVDPEAMFDAHDISFKGGIAYEITDRLTAGVAIGWFIEKIDIYRGSVFNTDLGLTYRATDELSLGASVTNLGPDFSLAVAGKPGSSDIALPTTYRIGGAYRYDRFMGTADLLYLDEELHGHIGLEGWLHEYVALRSGYMLNYDSKNFTAGLSVVRRNLSIEYAFVPYSNDLGTSHLFNLSVTL